MLNGRLGREDGRGLPEDLDHLCEPQEPYESQPREVEVVCARWMST